MFFCDTTLVGPGLFSKPNRSGKSVVVQLSIELGGRGTVWLKVHKMEPFNKPRCLSSVMTQIVSAGRCNSGDFAQTGSDSHR
jgi:hypothetical protein